MNATLAAATRGLVATGGAMMAVGGMLATGVGAAPAGPTIAAAAVWPRRRRMSPRPGTQTSRRTSTPDTGSGRITDSVSPDGVVVSRGTVRIVAYEPRTAGAPTNQSTYVTLRHRRGTPFGFAIVRLTTTGELRAYILDQPGYGNRDASAQRTHRLRDRRGRPYVCWDTRVDDVAQMMWIAREWAERTMRYIDTGVLIEVEDPSAAGHPERVERERLGR